MNINSNLCDNIRPDSYDLRWPFTTHVRSLLLLKKIFADEVVWDFKLILLENETGKKFWRIIIKQELTWPLDGIEGSIESSNDMLKCNCTCSSEIGTICPQKTTKIHVFWSNLANQRLYSCFEGINFQRFEKKLSQKLPYLQALLTL